MFNGDGGGAMTGNNDVINNNKRTAVVYATEAGELYTSMEKKPIIEFQLVTLLPMFVVL